MPIRDSVARKASDRERFRRRTEQRKAQGLCPRCGVRPPASGRSLCDPCSAKRRASERSRDARRRAAGIPRRRNVAAERARDRQRTAGRIARGVCTKCGARRPKPERRLCGVCAARRREAERLRYRKARDAGLKYGGRRVEGKRRSARMASRKRRTLRREANLCTRCGRRPPVEGGATCAPCREIRQAAEREQYRARRAAGLCVTCARPTFAGEARCGVCATIESQQRDRARKNAASRRRYWARRSAHRCTDCNSPSFGASRCPDCAERSYARSDHMRGMPVYPTSFAVILIATEECLATFDDEMDAIAFIAFENLSRHEVEVVRDAHPLASLAGWE